MYMYQHGGAWNTWRSHWAVAAINERAWLLANLIMSITAPCKIIFSPALFSSCISAEVLNDAAARGWGLKKFHEPAAELTLRLLRVDRTLDITQGHLELPRTMSGQLWHGPGAQSCSQCPASPTVGNVSWAEGTPQCQFVPSASRSVSRHCWKVLARCPRDSGTWSRIPLSLLLSRLSSVTSPLHWGGPRTAAWPPQCPAGRRETQCASRAPPAAPAPLSFSATRALCCLLLQCFFYFFTNITHSFITFVIPP